MTLLLPADCCPGAGPLGWSCCWCLSVHLSVPGPLSCPAGRKWEPHPQEWLQTVAGQMPAHQLHSHNTLSTQSASDSTAIHLGFQKCSTCVLANATHAQHCTQFQSMIITSYTKPYERLHWPLFCPANSMDFLLRGCCLRGDKLVLHTLG